MAVSIPAGARAGTYDVTLTARLANGQARAGAGRLTVSGGGAVAAGRKSGPAARLRLTAVLPKRLSVRIARRRGIVVLIGANLPWPGAGAALPRARYEAEGVQERAAEGARPRPSGAEEPEPEGRPLSDRDRSRRAQIRAARDAREVAAWGVGDRSAWPSRPPSRRNRSQSGCVVFQSGIDASPQSQIISEFPVKLVVCASGRRDAPTAVLAVHRPRRDRTGAAQHPPPDERQRPVVLHLHGPKPLAFTQSPT